MILPPNHVRALVQFLNGMDPDLLYSIRVFDDLPMSIVLPIKGVPNAYKLVYGARTFAIPTVMDDNVALVNVYDLADTFASQVTGRSSTHVNKQSRLAMNLDYIRRAAKEPRA